MSLKTNPVSSGYSTGVINSNFKKIEEYVNDNLLNRDGVTPGEPNQMEASLDMNSQDILNVGSMGAEEIVLDGTSLKELLGNLPNPGSGGIESIVAGSGIAVDDSDPVNPVVSATGGGSGGGVESIVAGDGINVDDSDPANPVVSAVGGGSSEPGIPAGGTVGQVLTKATAEDFDVVWQTSSGGGGGGGITSPTISRIITSTNPDEPLEDGDLLVVLPQPRVIAATYSELTYGESSEIVDTDVQIPFDAEPGDLVVLLVGSSYVANTPPGYTHVITQDSPRSRSATGLGRTTVFQKTVDANDVGMLVSISQTSAGRMSAIAVVVRTPTGTPNITESVSSNYEGSDDYLEHTVPNVVSPRNGCLAISTFNCAFSQNSGDTTVSWPTGWTPITPLLAGDEPAHTRLRSWAGYRNMRLGENTGGGNSCYHGVTAHDGSSVTLLIEST